MSRYTEHDPVPSKSCPKCDGHGYYYGGHMSGVPYVSSVTPCDCGASVPGWVKDVRAQIERDGQYISPYWPKTVLHPDMTPAPEVNPLSQIRTLGSKMTPTTIWGIVVGDLHYWYLAVKLSAQMIWDRGSGTRTNVNPHNTGSFLCEQGTCEDCDAVVEAWGEVKRWEH